MKIHWLLPSTILSIAILTSPALAAKLESWRFDGVSKQLEFTTDDAVQPQAQLIFNPTRLVIDLPGTTLGKPSFTQSVGGAIRAIRFGQFDEQKTRIVVELNPGYTLDPQLVKFTSRTGNQWVVQLPSPERVETTSPVSGIYSVVTDGIAQTTSQTNIIENLQVTGDGFFIRTHGNNHSQIEVNRSDNRSVIDINIKGATLSPSLQQQQSIDRYGVNSIQFTQLQSAIPTVRMTLHIDKNSPNWRATVSGSDGIVVLPDSGVVKSQQSNNQPDSVTQLPTSPSTIESVELASNGTQLLIRSDRSLSNVTSNWDRQTTLYRIAIPNAKLANNITGPTLNANSPVLRVRLQQQERETVVIYIQPASRVQIKQLNQINSQILALEFQRQRLVSPPSTSITKLPVPFPPLPTPFPDPDSPPTTASEISQPITRSPKGRILIVIDPGHGGKDAGAIGLQGLQEKDVILRIGKKVASLLEQNGIKVIMTRDADYFVDLAPRVVMAEHAHADLFVSIHANSIDNNPSANGLETYHYDRGYRLAQVVHKSILQGIPTLKDRGVKRARFYVLRKNTMPAILIETGFVTGSEDNPRLANPEYDNRMAEAIVRGILRYLQQR
ncbi:N-acetylmuramoyl-L-alanine amidase [Nostocaceae cyanobacterium CENA369]|uniref:N-acetylmuramoyl-L-alanine amidase n=1 Tax=Dendronalium phyllosphericum CENA369 TaxID=1725256 RepID=A0A8J7IIN7_9NOST|nr:N-acetylmuramoyl-L-alanine amidase [Dendronalium phyllosphericum]MBH8577596.1 N-acetylmuramoyl-L-alanine amidase [Dendronalium phyllosphericum CENA369]